MICPFCKGELPEGDECVCGCGRKYILGDNKSVLNSDCVFDVAERVYVANREHPFCLEMGIVAEKQGVFYRVKMVSTDVGINGRFVWFPGHWLRVFPKEWRNA